MASPKSWQDIGNPKLRHRLRVLGEQQQERYDYVRSLLQRIKMGEISELSSEELKSIREFAPELNESDAVANTQLSGLAPMNPNWRLAWKDPEFQDYVKTLALKPIKREAGERLSTPLAPSLPKAAPPSLGRVQINAENLKKSQGLGGAYAEGKGKAKQAISLDPFFRTLSNFIVPQDKQPTKNATLTKVTLPPTQELKRIELGLQKNEKLLAPSKFDVKPSRITMVIGPNGEPVPIYTDYGAATLDEINQMLDEQNAPWLQRVMTKIPYYIGRAFWTGPGKLLTMSSVGLEDQATQDIQDLKTLPALVNLAQAHLMNAVTFALYAGARSTYKWYNYKLELADTLEKAYLNNDLETLSMYSQDMLTVKDEIVSLRKSGQMGIKFIRGLENSSWLYREGVDAAWKALTGIEGRAAEAGMYVPPGSDLAKVKAAKSAEEEVRRRQDAARMMNIHHEDAMEFYRQATVADEADRADLFNKAVEAEMMSLQSYRESDPFDILGAYTWYSEPRRYGDFLRALASFQIQKGRKATESEVRQIKDLYSNPWTEGVGQGVFDLSWLIPAKALEAVATPIRIAVKGKASALLMSLGEKNVLRIIFEQSHSSVASKMFATVFNTSERMARAFDTGDELLDGMEEVSKVAREMSEAPTRAAKETIFLEARKTNKAIQQLQFDEFLTFTKTENVIDPTQWGTALQESIDKVKMRVQQDLVRRLVHEGMTLDEATERVTEEMVHEAVHSPKYTKEYLGDFADHFRRAFIDTKRVFKGSHLLEDTLLGYTAKVTNEILGGSQAKAIPFIHALDFVVGVGVMAKSLWASMVLTLNPGYIIRNIIDSSGRGAVVGGGAFFDDIISIFNHMHGALADELGFIPIEAGQSLARMGLDFPDSIPARFLYHDWTPGANIFAYFRYEYDRLKELDGAAKTLTEAMPEGLRKKFLGFDGFRRKLTRVVPSISGGMADFNTAVEFTMRLRTFHRKYFAIMDVLEPEFRATITDGLSPAAARIASQVWDLAESNPSRLTDMIELLTGEFAEARRPKFLSVLPPGFGDSLPQGPTTQRTFIREIGNQTSQFVADTIKRTGEFPTNDAIRNYVKDVRKGLTDSIQAQLASNMPLRDLDNGINVGGRMAAEPGIQDLQGSLPHVEAPPPPMPGIAELNRYKKQVIADTVTVYSNAVDKFAKVKRSATAKGISFMGQDEAVTMIIGDDILKLSQPKFYNKLYDATIEAIALRNKTLILEKGWSIKSFKESLGQFLENPEAALHSNGTAFIRFAEMFEDDPDAYLLLKKISGKKFPSYYPALKRYQEFGVIPDLKTMSRGEYISALNRMANTRPDVQRRGFALSTRKSDFHNMLDGLQDPELYNTGKLFINNNGYIANQWSEWMVFHFPGPKRPRLIKNASGQWVAEIVDDASSSPQLWNLWSSMKIEGIDREIEWYNEIAGLLDNPENLRRTMSEANMAPAETFLKHMGVDLTWDANHKIILNGTMMVQGRKHVLSDFELLGLHKYFFSEEVENRIRNIPLMLGQDTGEAFVIGGRIDPFGLPEEQMAAVAGGKKPVAIFAEGELPADMPINENLTFENLYTKKTIVQPDGKKVVQEVKTVFVFRPEDASKLTGWVEKYRSASKMKDEFQQAKAMGSLLGYSPADVNLWVRNRLAEQGRDIPPELLRTQLARQLQDVLGIPSKYIGPIVRSMSEQAKWWAEATGQSIESYYRRIGFARVGNALELEKEGQKMAISVKNVINIDDEGRVIFYGLGRETKDSVPDFIHNISTLFYSDLRDAAKFNDDIADELVRVNKFLGLEPEGLMTETQRQKFADLFVKYIFDGKLPSNSKMKKPFETFKGWLARMYGDVEGSVLSGNIPPDINLALNKMLIHEKNKPPLQHTVSRIAQIKKLNPRIEHDLQAAWEVYKKHPIFDGWNTNLFKDFETYKKFLLYRINTTDAHLADNFMRRLWAVEEVENAILNEMVPRTLRQQKKEWDDYAKALYKEETELSKLLNASTPPEELARVQARMHEIGQTVHPVAGMPYTPIAGAPPRVTDEMLYGSIIYPPLHSFQMNDGMKTWVRNNDFALSNFEAALQEIDKLEAHLLSGEYRLDRIPTEIADELKAWKEMAVGKKSEMVSLALNGGKYKNRTIMGAIEETNRIQIDYSSLSRMDHFMKNFLPFWTFPSRSLPFWGETLATHPQLVAAYMKLRRMSEQFRLQAGATNSQGKELPSLKGYLPIPGTDLWVNPLAPFSWTYVLNSFQNPDDLVYNMRNESDVPPGVWLTKTLTEMGQLYGFSTAPWIQWSFKKYFKVPDYALPALPITPQVSALIPRWQVADIIQKANVINFGGPGLGLGDIIYPEVSWHDYLTESDILSDAYAKAMTMSDEDGYAYIMDVAGAIAYKKGELPQDVIDQLSAKNPEKLAKYAEIWDTAYRKITTDERNRSLTGFFIGYYPKEFSDADADLLYLRNRMNAYKSALNNRFQTYLFGLSPDASENYERFNEMKDTPEGWISRLRTDIGWVVDEQNHLIQEPEERRQYLAQKIISDQNQSAYYAKTAAARENLDKELQAAGVGRPWEVYAPIYQRYADEMAEAASLNSYDVRWGTNAPVENIQKKLENGWFRMVWSTRPRFNFDGTEKYEDYQARLLKWEQDIPKLSSMMASYIRSRPVNSTMMALHEDQQIPQTFFNELVKKTTPDGIKQWQMQNDTIFDALNKAWEETYWNPYWESLKDPNSPSGWKSGYEYELAEMDYFNTHKEPTADELWNYLDTNYKGRFNKEEVVKWANYNPDTVWSVTERLEAERGPDFTLTDDVWNYLAMAGPGRNRSLIEKVLPAGQISQIEKWYDTGGTMFKDNPEGLKEFHDMLETAVAQLGVTPPTRDQLLEFIEAEKMNDQLKALVAKDFNMTVDALDGYISDYANMSRTDFKAKYKIDADKFNAWNAMQKYYNYYRPLWSRQNPLWGMYYLYKPTPPPQVAGAAAMQTPLPTEHIGSTPTSTTAPLNTGPVDLSKFQKVVTGNYTWPLGFSETVGPDLSFYVKNILTHEGQGWYLLESVKRALTRIALDPNAPHPEWAEWVRMILSKSAK